VSPPERTGPPRPPSDAGKGGGRRRTPAQDAGPRRAAAPARSRRAAAASPRSRAAADPSTRRRGTEAPGTRAARRPRRDAAAGGSSTNRGRGGWAAGAGGSSTNRGRDGRAAGTGGSSARGARGTKATGGASARPRRGTLAAAGASAPGRPGAEAAGGASARPRRDGRAEPAGRGAAAEQGDGGLLRLNKALSGAGLGSRRAVEELVRAGRVSVDGQVVHDLGRRVDPARDRVEVDGSRVVLDERRRYWLLNKPAGVITTAADPSGRPTVVGMVPDQPRVFPVGRLDRDTEGLLLLTNDGPLAYRLTHARYGVEKRYLAEVERLPAAAPAQLRQGVELEDGLARPVRVRVVAGSGRRRMIEVGLVEGRNREVRRLLDAVGAPVRRLVRTAVGPVRLTGLAPGEFRALRPDEVRGLYQAVGL
jgi:23S rRNA pseudouridine2605 synthase